MRSMRRGEERRGERRSGSEWSQDRHLIIPSEGGAGMLMICLGWAGGQCSPVQSSQICDQMFVVQSEGL